MAGNLLGTPFKDYVDQQINVRQTIHGKKSRTNQELQYLNSRNAWVKFGSGTWFTKERLDLIGRSNPLIKGVGEGKELAMNNVLFNGTSKLTGTVDEANIEARLDEFQKMAPNMSRDDIRKMTIRDLEKENTSYRLNTKSGVGKGKAYGFGGIEEFGYTPMPGITDVSIKDLNRGSIKKATINIIAHNRNQFDVIDNLYMRLGYSVLLEWGNDKYISKLDSEEKGVLSNVGSTLMENGFFDFDGDSYKNMLPNIELFRKKYSGNYDGMFGVISNFSWTFEDDGSYKIKVEVLSQGDVIESLKANLPPNKNESQGNATSINSYSKLALQNIKNSPIASEEEFYQTLYAGFKPLLQGFLDAYKNGYPGDGEKESYGLHWYNSIYGCNYGFGPAQLEPLKQVEVRNGWAVWPLDMKTYSNPEVQTQFPRNYELIVQGKPEPIVEKAVLHSLEKAWDDSFIAMRDDCTSGPLGNPTQNKFYYFNGVDGELVTDTKNRVTTMRTTKFQTYTPYHVDDFVLKYSQDKAKELGKSVTQIRRRIIAQNIDENSFFTYVFEYFEKKNYAGGDKDTVVNDPADANMTEQQQEDVAAEEQIELKKDENKVRSYFYNVRKVWGEFNIFDEPDRPITIGLDKKVFGNIISPIEPEGIKTWNKQVGFPKYDPNSSAILSSLVNRDFIKANYTDLEKQNYIRLGTFLRYLQINVVPKIDDLSDPQTPMLNIDTDTESNICYVIDNMLSLNPNKILIRNDQVWNTSQYIPYFPELKEFKMPSPNGKGWYGKIMNIYFNFNRLEEIFDGVDERDQISVFEVLKTIATDINSALGNVNNIEPIINKETNTVTFIDQTPIPEIKDIAANIPGIKNYNKKTTLLEIFGYNNNKSTFVRKTGISTQITKEYATIISIGATANGAIPGAESTAFSEWNVGIEDRFKNNILDGQSARNQTLRQQNEKVISNYINMSVRTFGKLGLNFKNDRFQINDELIELNQKVAGNFYIFAQAENSKRKSEPIESSIGFIPISLKLEMDGLSGLQIYNRLTVNSSFLPSNYGNTLDFIVTGVNHKLSNNEWVTNLDTLATIKKPK